MIYRSKDLCLIFKFLLCLTPNSRNLSSRISRTSLSIMVYKRDLRLYFNRFISKRRKFSLFLRILTNITLICLISMEIQFNGLIDNYILKSNFGLMQCYFLQSEIVSIIYGIIAKKEHSTLSKHDVWISRIFTL